MVIKRIVPVSCAKMLGAIYAVFGLIGGIIFSLISLAGPFAAVGPPVPGGALFGAFAVVFLPIVYGVIGFISALVAAWLYNVLVGFVGGIQMDVE